MAWIQEGNSRGHRCHGGSICFNSILCPITCLVIMYAPTISLIANSFIPTSSPLYSELQEAGSLETRCKPRFPCQMASDLVLPTRGPARRLKGRRKRGAALFFLLLLVATAREAADRRGLWCFCSGNTAPLAMTSR